MLQCGSLISNARHLWRWKGFCLNSVGKKDMYPVLMNQIYFLSTIGIDRKGDMTSGFQKDADNQGKRAKLRDMTPDTKVLQHLDSLKMGYLARRKERVAVAKRFASAPLRNLRQRTGRANSTNTISSASSSTDKSSADGANASKSVTAVKSQDRKRRRIDDTGIVPLKDRPYPFNAPGRAMTRIESAADLRTGLKSGCEIAIIGRSNVGKSTLINTLLGYDASYVQKSPMSDKPGETKSLHLFALGGAKVAMAIPGSGDKEIGSKSVPNSTPLVHRAYTAQSVGLVLTDMPGYGFAFMNETTTQRCQDLIFSYLTERGKSLKRVLLLIDARHGFKVTDKQFLEMLSQKLENVKQQAGDQTNAGRFHWKLQVVLTKCDLVERSTLARRLNIMRQDMQNIVPTRLRSELPVMPVSGLEKKGVLTLMRELAALVPAEHLDAFSADVRQSATRADAAAAASAQQKSPSRAPSTEQPTRSIGATNSKSSSAAAVFARDKERSWDKIPEK